MKRDKIPESVIEIGKINFIGNVTPHTWYSHIRHESGKPNLVAITLLADICYWYRPIIVRDEKSGEITQIKKKFKGMKLQKSYTDYAKQFGLTKKQVRDAITFLEKNGFITKKIEPVVVTEKGKVLSNVLYLEPISGKIIDISDPFSETETETEQAVQAPTEPAPIAPKKKKSGQKAGKKKTADTRVRPFQKFWIENYPHGNYIVPGDKKAAWPKWGNQIKYLLKGIEAAYSLEEGDEKAVTILKQKANEFFKNTDKWYVKKAHSFDVFMSDINAFNGNGNGQGSYNAPSTVNEFTVDEQL